MILHEAASGAEEQVLVSVLIACYNHEKYIEECIESVLGQTYPNIELLVVDDGSRDNSVKVIERLQKKYGFDFVAQQNQGLPRTLNSMIARCRGTLITPFGSDDVMLPERIEKQVRYLQGKPEVGICAGNIEGIDENSLPLAKQPRGTAERMDFAAAFIRRPPFAPTLLFRREALEAVGGFDEHIPLEDLLIALKVAHAGYYIDTLEDVLVRYRMHSSNTSANKEFMVLNVLKTYDFFTGHPLHPVARAKYINSTLLKLARKDKQLFRDLLRELPVSQWNGKTLRALARYIFG